MLEALDRSHTRSREHARQRPEPEVRDPLAGLFQGEDDAERLGGREPQAPEAAGVITIATCLFARPTPWCSSRSPGWNSTMLLVLMMRCFLGPPYPT